MGHTKDVLSVAFSADNRQIVSGSRDHTIKLWNTLGVCKYTIQVTIMAGSDHYGWGGIVMAGSDHYGWGGGDRYGLEPTVPLA